MTTEDHKTDEHGHITEIPDVSYIKNVDVTHETSDVNVPALLKFVLALTIMTAVSFVLMLILFNFLNARETQKEPPAGPMAMSEQESLPPEPRLQSARGFGVKLENGQWVSLETREPQAEYHVVREQWLQSLKEGPKDQSGRPIGIPIETAMQKFVTEQSARAGANKTPAHSEGYGDSLPTAASSGRVSIKQ